MKCRGYDFETVVVLVSSFPVPLRGTELVGIAG